MKGRYNGCHMTIYGHTLPGATSLANWAARTNISEKAKQRLKGHRLVKELITITSA